MSDAEKLTAFMQQNFGVLVTPDASGQFACQICGERALFAGDIVHYFKCLFKPFERHRNDSQ